MSRTLRVLLVDDDEDHVFLVRRALADLAGVAVAVEVADGVVRAARAAFVSVTPVPTVLDLTPVLAGSDAGAPVTDRVADEVVELVRAHVDPEGDIHASADYRRMLAGELTRRALAATTDEEGAA